MDKFYSYIDSSEAMTLESSEYLSSLVEKYPYFQAVRSLYLKNLKVTGSQAFDEQFLKGAPLFPDRRRLFFFLNPIVSSDSKEVRNVEVDSKNESESSFILIEDAQNGNGSLVDITDNSKILETPITGYELLEISETESNGKASSAITVGEYSIEKTANEDWKTDSLTNDDLIDQFIKSNPRLKPPQIMPQDQEDISLKSLTEPEDLITEPIAKIYLAQGLTDKAISIYEKLSLKYPEKSSYFAGQILEIKKQLNK